MVLVSKIKELKPIDPRSPKTIRLIFKGISSKHGKVDFDTQESAQDWWKEMQGLRQKLTTMTFPHAHVVGALFVYRHTRSRALHRNSEVDTDWGARLSIPLTRVASVEFSQTDRENHGMTLHIHADADNTTEEGGSLARILTVQFVNVQPSDVLGNLNALISKAKADSLLDDAVSSKVFIDFGLLNFFGEVGEDQATVANSRSAREKAIRAALALEDDLDVWCKP